MPESIELLANSMMNTFYKFVSEATKTEVVPSAPAPFVCWCKPGIPFTADEFRFAQFKMLGQGATDEQRIQDAFAQQIQAAYFSRFVDFVPSANGVVQGNIEGGVLRPGAGTLSLAYEQLLSNSEAGTTPPLSQAVSDQIEAKIARLAAIKDTYDKFRVEHDAALIKVNAARFASTSTTAGMIEWSTNGTLLTAEHTRAKNNWTTFGKQAEYDALQAEIRNMELLRTPAVLRARAIDRFGSANTRVSAPFLGENIPVTIPYPGSFATSNEGWTEFSTKRYSFASFANAKSTKYDIGGGVKWGSFKLGASQAGGTEEKIETNSTESFGLSLMVAMVPLLRGWFDPWFLSESRMWRVRKDAVEIAPGTIASTGGSGSAPPQGILIGYPVAAIFVRDVKISLEDLKNENSAVSQSLKRDGKLGWGFGALNIGGSYERNGQTVTQGITRNGAELTVNGLQLVGFLCEVVKKAPDPRPELFST